MNLLFANTTPRHYWVDDLDPWIVHVSGDFGIRWYGLSYAAGDLKRFAEAVAGLEHGF